jgi:DNA-binding transcriptional ArsR family regulator
MVKYQPESLDAIFFALADPTRRAIVERLARREHTVSELAEPFAISLPAVSKHLRVLEHAGLLVQEKDGRIRRCHLDPTPLAEVGSWVEQYQQFWETRLDVLADFLDESQSQKEKDRDASDTLD